MSIKYHLWRTSPSVCLFGKDGVKEETYAHNILTTDIPYGELDILVLDSFDVETCVAA